MAQKKKKITFLFETVFETVFISSTGLIPKVEDPDLCLLFQLPCSHSLCIGFHFRSKKMVIRINSIQFNQINFSIMKL